MLKSLRRFKTSVNYEEARSDLNTLLYSLNPSNPLEERIEALVKVMEWMRGPVTLRSGEEPIEGLVARNLRLKFLLQVLERNEEIGHFFAATFQEITSKGRAVRLFCLTGIPENNAFLVELFDRIVQNLLPPILREKDLGELFKFVFSEEEDVRWFAEYPDEIIPPVKALLNKYGVTTSGLIHDLDDALIILGAQISALGISKQIRRHLDYQHISETSFFKLSMAINRNEDQRLILEEIIRSKQTLEQVRSGLEKSGVSADIIHYLERINALLNRIEMILYLKYHQGTFRAEAVTSRFISKLIRDELNSLGIKDYIRQNVHLLTRKIVEFSGHKGETYIASTRAERVDLFVAASWAGVLTAFTAVIKYWIGLASLPLFIEGLFFFVNYALSFLLMQKWHLALSSKQPAYTASALSRKFEQFLKTKRLSPVIIELRRVIRSQSIAAWANLLWVIPIVALLDTLWFWAMNDHIVSPFVARDVVSKHKLWKSLSLVYAALTGVLLWLSSVVAGWMENWMLFRGIPDLMRQSPLLKKILGPSKLERLTDSAPSSMGAFAGNISIAFFLAAPVIIGKITGIPLDIRHVTLAAGTVTLGLAGMGWSWEYWPLYVEMALTIIIIGLLNFGISFYFAIRMAALARNMDSKYLKIIFRFTLRKLRNPGSSESD